MVFTSIVRLARSRGPDEFWRKRKIFKMAAHFRGRKRNCYSISIRYVHRALVYATTSRLLKKQDMQALWNTRLEAACAEHNVSFSTFKDGLVRNDILINNKVLSELAAWEPATFKSLANLALKRAQDDGIASLCDRGSDDVNVITRGMLRASIKD